MQLQLIVKRRKEESTGQPIALPRMVLLRALRKFIVMMDTGFGQLGLQPKHQQPLKHE